MKTSPVLVAFSACILSLSFISSARAALILELGGQVVYDTDRNITWLANANLAGSNTFGLSTGVNLGAHPNDTSGVGGYIYSSGAMNWSGALFWIDAMNAANYLGFNDWRLASAIYPDSGCSINGSGSSSPSGYTCTASEISHLYYDEFGVTSGYPVLTSGNPTELAKFTNLYDYWYWYGNDLASDSTSAWAFNMNNGLQAGVNKGGAEYAWVVHDGDLASLVSTVPVPAAFWLFGSGLLGLVGTARRKKSFRIN